MAKDFAKAFYKSSEWLRCREAYISMRGGLCEDCLTKGRFTPGTTVHHVIPITPENITDQSITLSFANLRLVCTDCHAAEHRKNQRYTFDEIGRVIFPDDLV